MHHQQSLKSKTTKSSVIESQSCTSNQVKLFFEPCIAFFVQIWSLCLQSYTKQASQLAVDGLVHQLSILLSSVTMPDRKISTAGVSNTRADCSPPHAFVWPANISKTDKIRNFDEIQLILRGSLLNCIPPKLFLINCGPRSNFSFEQGPQIYLSLRSPNIWGSS